MEVYYKPSDIVWVKLGPFWWPGEVVDKTSVPELLIESLKKDPIAIVRYFDDDGFYEIVKTPDRIFPYNCERKHDFIKKGMDAFRAKNPKLTSFPKDVSAAEIKTGGNANILSDPAFSGERKRNYAAEIFGTSNVKKPRESNKGRPTKSDPIITHRRFLGYDDYEARVLIQSPEETPQEDLPTEGPCKKFTCPICQFTTERLGILMKHTSCHMKDVSFTSRQTIKKPQKRKRRKALSDEDLSDDEKKTKTKRKYVKKKDEETLVADDEKSENDVSVVEKEGAKRKVKKKTTLPTVEQKKDVCTDIIADWDDESNQEDSIEANATVDTTFNESQEEIDLTRNDSFGDSSFAIHLTDVDDLQSTKITIDITDDSEKEKSEEDKTTDKSVNKSCFDFDEDEEETRIPDATSGRKIPRVIPISERRKTFEFDDIPVDEEEEKKKKILEESEELAKLSEPSKDDDKATENLEKTYQSLMESTENIELPDVPNILKNEQNFRSAKTVKYPDKPEEDSSDLIEAEVVDDKAEKSDKMEEPEKVEEILMVEENKETPEVVDDVIVEVDLTSEVEKELPEQSESSQCESLEEKMLDEEEVKQISSKGRRKKKNLYPMRTRKSTRSKLAVTESNIDALLSEYAAQTKDIEEETELGSDEIQVPLSVLSSSKEDTVEIDLSMETEKVEDVNSQQEVQEKEESNTAETLDNNVPEHIVPAEEIQSDAVQDKEEDKVEIPKEPIFEEAEIVIEQPIEICEEIAISTEQVETAEKSSKITVEQMETPIEVEKTELNHTEDKVADEELPPEPKRRKTTRGYSRSSKSKELPSQGTRRGRSKDAEVFKLEESASSSMSESTDQKEQQKSVPTRRSSRRKSSNEDKDTSLEESVIDPIEYISPTYEEIKDVIFGKVEIKETVDTRKEESISVPDSEEKSKNDVKSSTNEDEKKDSDPVLVPTEIPPIEGVLEEVKEKENSLSTEEPITLEEKIVESNADQKNHEQSSSKKTEKTTGERKDRKSSHRSPRKEKRSSRSDKDHKKDESSKTASHKKDSRSLRGDKDHKKEESSKTDDNSSHRKDNRSLRGDKDHKKEESVKTDDNSSQRKDTRSSRGDKDNKKDESGNVDDNSSPSSHKGDKYNKKEESSKTEDSSSHKKDKRSLRGDKDHKKEKSNKKDDNSSHRKDTRSLRGDKDNKKEESENVDNNSSHREDICLLIGDTYHKKEESSKMDDSSSHRKDTQSLRGDKDSKKDESGKVDDNSSHREDVRSLRGDKYHKKEESSKMDDSSSHRKDNRSVKGDGDNKKDESEKVNDNSSHTEDNQSLKVDSSSQKEDSSFHRSSRSGRRSSRQEKEKQDSSGGCKTVPPEESPIKQPKDNSSSRKSSSSKDTNSPKVEILIDNDQVEDASRKSTRRDKKSSRTDQDSQKHKQVNEDELDDRKEHNLSSRSSRRHGRSTKNYQDSFKLPEEKDTKVSSSASTEPEDSFSLKKEEKLERSQSSSKKSTKTSKQVDSIKALFSSSETVMKTKEQKREELKSIFSFDYGEKELKKRKTYSHKRKPKPIIQETSTEKETTMDAVPTESKEISLLSSITQEDKNLECIIDETVIESCLQNIEAPIDLEQTLVTFVASQEISQQPAKEIDVPHEESTFVENEEIISVLEETDTICTFEVPANEIVQQIIESKVEDEIVETEVISENQNNKLAEVPEDKISKMIDQDKIEQSSKDSKLENNDFKIEENKGTVETKEVTEKSSKSTSRKKRKPSRWDQIEKPEVDDSQEEKNQGDKEKNNEESQLQNLEAEPAKETVEISDDSQTNLGIDETSQKEMNDIFSKKESSDLADKNADQIELIFGSSPLPGLTENNIFIEKTEKSETLDDKQELSHCTEENKKEETVLVDGSSHNSSFEQGNDLLESVESQVARITHYEEPVPKEEKPVEERTVSIFDTPEKIEKPLHHHPDSVEDKIDIETNSSNETVTSKPEESINYKLESSAVSAPKTKKTYLLSEQAKRETVEKLPDSIKETSANIQDPTIPPKSAKKTNEVATKLTNPKKRFVKSFEDFELNKKKEESLEAEKSNKSEVKSETSSLMRGKSPIAFKLKKQFLSKISNIFDEADEKKETKLLPKLQSTKFDTFRVKQKDPVTVEETETNSTTSSEATTPDPQVKTDNEKSEVSDVVDEMNKVSTEEKTEDAKISNVDHLLLKERLTSDDANQCQETLEPEVSSADHSLLKERLTLGTSKDSCQETHKSEVSNVDHSPIKEILAPEISNNSCQEALRPDVSDVDHSLLKEMLTSEITKDSCQEALRPDVSDVDHSLLKERLTSEISKDLCQETPRPDVSNVDYSLITETPAPEISKAPGQDTLSPDVTKVDHSLLEETPAPEITKVTCQETLRPDESNSDHSLLEEKLTPEKSKDSCQEILELEVSEDKSSTTADHFVPETQVASQNNSASSSIDSSRKHEESNKVMPVLPDQFVEHHDDHIDVLTTEIITKNFPLDENKKEETEYVSIDGNLTVVSEKELAEGQVEITASMPSKKPMTLLSFSMDFSDDSSDASFEAFKKEKIQGITESLDSKNTDEENKEKEQEVLENKAEQKTVENEVIEQIVVSEEKKQDVHDIKQKEAAADKEKAVDAKLNVTNDFEIEDISSITITTQLEKKTDKVESKKEEIHDINLDDILKSGTSYEKEKDQPTSLKDVDNDLFSILSEHVKITSKAASESVTPKSKGKDHEKSGSSKKNERKSQLSTKEEVPTVVEPLVIYNTVKSSTVTDMCDLEDHIPSQIVCTKNALINEEVMKVAGINNELTKEGTIQNAEPQMSKLLSRLTTDKKEDPISKIKATEAEAKTKELELKSSKVDPTAPKNLLKAAIKSKSMANINVAYPPKSVNKAIILSEKIIRPAREMSASASLGSKRTYEDVEDIEPYVITKTPKLEAKKEETPASGTQKIASSSISKLGVNSPKQYVFNANKQVSSLKKSTGKAKILNQTIIRPAGESIQSKALTEDNIDFDINSMPIVLSDELLTPETLENIPIVLGEQAQKATSASENMKIVIEKKAQNNSKLVTKTAVMPSASAVSSPTVRMPIMKRKTPTILQTPKQTAKIIRQVTPSVSTKSAKFVVVSDNMNRPGPVMKKQPNLLRKAVPVTCAASSTPGNSSESTGHKIMIFTNQQGKQQRLLLTPQQQKLFGMQVAGKTVMKSATVAQKSQLAKVQNSSLASTSKLPGQSVQSPKLIKTTVGNTVATTPQMKIVPPRKTQKVFMPGTQVNKPPQQKTILITNQHGQTVRKIQGTNEALLDKQVAEQLEAIKVSSMKAQQKQHEATARASIATKPTPVSSRKAVIKRPEPKQTIVAQTKPTHPTTTTISGPSRFVEHHVPPLTPIKQDKKTEEVLKQATQTKPSQNKPNRPLHQLVIQDNAGNQTTITEGQILALPSETVDGQPQSYMLVTLDETGNLTPLNNEALMSLDPSLAGLTGGDLSNMVLQMDAGASKGGLSQTAQLQAATPAIVQEKPKQEVQLPVAPSKPEEQVVAPLEQPAAQVQVTCNINGEPGQQIIVTGDPTATQKFLDSLTDGSTDLSNLLAGAEGNSFLIQADGQQILINTEPTEAPLLRHNTSLTEQPEQGSPMFSSHPVKNQDILAAALADTDVFQQDQVSNHGKLTHSQLSPGQSLFPMNVGNVLETSLTLNSPIMTPLEVPSTNSKRIPDEEADILTTHVPKNVDLPITITDPNISQTVSHQQVLMASDLQSNLELSLPISETSMCVTSGMNSPSFVYSLPSLEVSNHTEIGQKTFSSSMPLLTEDIEESPAFVSISSKAGEIQRSVPLHRAESSFVTTKKQGKHGIVESMSTRRMTPGGTFMEEGLCTLGAEMCSSLSEPPPEMFDIPMESDGLNFLTKSQNESKEKSGLLMDDNSLEMQVQSQITAEFKDSSQSSDSSSSVSQDKTL